MRDQKMKKSVSQRTPFSVGLLVIYICLVIFAITCFYPFIYVLALAVMPYENYVQSSVHFFFDGFTLEYFEKIAQNSEILFAFMRSVIRVLLGTTLNVIVTMLAAYALSRKGLKHGKWMVVLFLIPMYFSAGLIPYYVTLNAYHLTNKFMALILPGLVSSMQFFIAKSNLSFFPEEIIEASEADGCGPIRTFISIVWPCYNALFSKIFVFFLVCICFVFFWCSRAARFFFLF